MRNSIITKPSGSTVIGPLDGQAVIAQAQGVFCRFIDREFETKWLAKPGRPTPEMTLDIREMTGDAMFERLFVSISPDLAKLAVTQHQIINFCENSLPAEWQCGFFLIVPSRLKSLMSYMPNFIRVMKFWRRFYSVVSVGRADGLFVSVRSFDNQYVWQAEHGLRIVFPQLAV